MSAHRSGERAIWALEVEHECRRRRAGYRVRAEGRALPRDGFRKPRIGFGMPLEVIAMPCDGFAMRLDGIEKLCDGFRKHPNQLAKDAVEQRTERATHDALESKYTHAHETFGVDQEQRHVRFSAALKAARGAFNKDKAVMAELDRFKRSVVRPKKKAKEA